jgi:hypothetical protein
MVHKNSDEEVMATIDPVREPTPPPQFDDHPDNPPAFSENGGHRGSNVATNSTLQQDFPQVGELPIPHLSPMTVHVNSSSLYH